jgi:phage gpG-like protein
MPDIVRVDSHELAGAIYQLRARGSALSKLMPAFADALVAAVGDVYEAEGPGWADLAESTIKARRGSTYKILQDTGVMAGSTSPGYGLDWAEAYAGAAYADFHATGTSRMPKRNPFELGPFETDVLEDLAQMAADEVAK